jgi:ATP/maltotriose-dependent transcriptional regulator MalT/DNA-binding SARP family transcriptional activator
LSQRSTTTAFAKSTRPEIAGVFRREALFDRLDGTVARTVAWISAPPGYGKTTLAASYLEARSYRWAWYQVDPDDDDGETFLHYLAHAMHRLRAPGDQLPAFGPEHRADLAGFARRYFRALFAGVVGPVALVLDNLHELKADSPLRTLLGAGLPQIPRQCCVIVTSREAPPPVLARLQVSGQMVCLGVDDLRMTATELGEMAHARGRPLDPELLAQLQHRADGWAAVLVLMVEHHKLADAQATLPGEATPKAVFDYLAGEIFERFDDTTRQALLQLACLPRVTIEVARRLSGDKAIDRVLFNLAQNDYFVRELVGADGRVFVFHPLLREFLLHRAARDLPHAVAAPALRRAAQLLRESGQPEDALALFVESRDWSEAAAVIAEQAGPLLAQHRHATLAAWLDQLPPAFRSASPALLIAQGSALLHTSPRVARRRFEEAFDALQREGDRPAMARCCLGAIAALVEEFDDLTGLDRWLQTRDACTPDAADEEPPPGVRIARLWRDPMHPEVSRIAAAHGADPDPRGEVARATAAGLNGDFAGAAAIVQAIKDTSGPTRIAIATSESLRRLVDGDAEGALAAARGGLAVAQAEAIAGSEAWLRLMVAAAATALGEVETARGEIDAVQALALRRGDRGFVHYLRGGIARAGGDGGEALREWRSAALLGAEAGLPWLECLARIAVAQGLAGADDRLGADAQLRAAEALARQLGNPLLQGVAWFTQAAIAIDRGDEAAALAPLQTGLALARDRGIRHVPGLSPTQMGRLCATALRAGIAVDQVRSLVSAGRLPPPPAASRLQRWPWAFEVFTFGGFGLQRANQAIEFSAKGPGRPVELLKVLISIGGQNVRADQLADALWPHVDADYAHKSFTATLHRLRRIFGDDDALKLRDGRLSLNDRLFRVDVWTLDHLLGEIDACLRADDARAADRQLIGLFDEVLLRYKGPFLPDEAEQPAYVARREQTRARLLRALTRAGRRWEDGGRSDVAIDCYLRCIDADELCEAFYRNLMLCCQRHGDAAEALATYDRLQAVLAARLGRGPSPETQAIHAGLRPGPA